MHHECVYSDSNSSEDDNNFGSFVTPRDLKDDAFARQKSTSRSHSFVRSVSQELSVNFSSNSTEKDQAIKYISDNQNNEEEVLDKEKFKYVSNIMGFENKEKVLRHYVESYEESEQAFVLVRDLKHQNYIVLLSIEEKDKKYHTNMTFFKYNYQQN